MKNFGDCETIVVTLLDEATNLKQEKKHCPNQEKIRIVDEGTTKRLEVCKKVEEALTTNEIKSEMQSKVEEGRNKLM